jgi:hypothetical protein
VPQSALHHLLTVFETMSAMSGWLLRTLVRDKNGKQGYDGGKIKELLISIDKQGSEDEIMNKEYDKVYGIDFPHTKDKRPIECHIFVGRRANSHAHHGREKK